MNRRRYFACLCILCVLLSGCSILPGKLEKFEQDVSAVLPNAKTEAPAAPIGDSKTGEILNAVLYYPSADGLGLIPVNRTLWLTSGKRAEERLAQELLKAPSSENLLPAAPDGMALDWTVSTANALTLSFSLSGDAPGNEALVRFLSALGATFSSADRARPVNALINGRAVSVYGLPAGAVGAAEADPAAWTQPDGARVSRSAVVYCPSADGLYVVPEVRRVELDAETLLKSLLNELMKSPATDGLLPGIPLAAGALEKEPSIEITEDLQKFANLYFTMDLYNALEVSAEEREQFLAALVLTFSDFLRDFDGMRVYIAGHLVTEVPASNGEMKKFDAGVIRRSDFSDLIGDLVTLYFADEDGRLVSEPRATAYADSDSLRSLVRMLMEGARAEGHLSTFPKGLTDEDLLGATVKDNVALLNFSSEFYGLSRELDENAEQTLVYSLVNTLCGLDRVRAVRIYIDGECVDTLSGGICLSGVLLPNPGLCAQSSDKSMEGKTAS